MWSKKNKIIIALMFAAVLIISATAFFTAKKLNPDFNFYELIRPRLPDNALEIIFSKPQYILNEEIFFGVLNKTNQTLRVENECPGEPLEVYRLENNVWMHLKNQAKIMCKSTKDIVIQPYELKGSSYLPWQGVIFSVPGKYKIELRVEGYGNKFEKEFEIAARPL